MKCKFYEGSGFLLIHFLISFSTYNALHVEDISKDVYQVEKWIADVEKTEMDFLLLLS